MSPEEADAVFAPTAAQTRIISAASELFARWGVRGTSLQMIADAVGVTKAAVYHQFHSKDQIVVAAAEAELARLEGVLDAARARPDPEEGREFLLRGIVDLAVERRGTVKVVLNDPVVLRTFAGHGRYQRAVDRLGELLTAREGDEPDRVLTALFMAAVSGAVLHPIVADLDEETLRSQLLLLVRRFC